MFHTKKSQDMFCRAWYGEVGGTPLWAHAEASLPPEVPAVGPVQCRIEFIQGMGRGTEKEVETEKEREKERGRERDRDTETERGRKRPGTCVGVREREKGSGRESESERGQRE